jgi:hypothetical protein
MKTIRVVGIAIVFSACGPSARKPGNGGGPDSGGGNCSAPAPENTVAACTDGIDNDCDGVVDCADPDCSGIGPCPVCGMVQHPTGGGIELPDGLSSGASCTISTTCGASTPNCVENECHASYTSKLNFTGFGATQTMTAVSNIQSVCVNIEHSWLRDLEIQLKSPSGQVLQLCKFEGRTGGEIFLGIPNDDDSGNGQLDDGLNGDPPPTPGVGWDYCWIPGASNPDMLAFVHNTAGDATVQYTLPAGNYSAAGPWSTLIGSTLNGDWEIIVTDLWAEDNGFIFKWSIAFDPSIVQNCSGPPIQ